MLISILFWIIAFISAITVHEAAHAFMADKLGDPTPKLMGRLSLNPLVHYDPIGTTLLFALVIMRALGAPVIPFGWAKPVQFDPYNLKNPRRDAALISLAGPLSNIIFAVAISVVLRLVIAPFSPVAVVSAILYPMIVLNIVLAIFNLIPIHPLDGGKILVGILPQSDAMELDNFLRRYGMILLVFLIFPTIGGKSAISMFLSPILSFFLNILLPGSSI